MAEWATLKVNQGLRSRISMENTFLPLIFGGCLARGTLLGLHPFGIAFGAAVILLGDYGALFGILGIILGTITLGITTLKDVSSVVQITVILAAMFVLLPFIRRRKHEGVYLILITAVMVAVVSSLALSLSNPDTYALFSAALQSILAGGFAIIFWFAMGQKEAIWRGEFQREQGIAWLLILIGIISGLQGVQVKEINFAIVLMSFFTLFVSERYGAGTSAGVGAILGFLPQLSISTDNLVAAGIYGLAGFCTGAFRRFGKIGLGTAFIAVMLMLTIFLRQEAVYSQLISSVIGLLLFFFGLALHLRGTF